MLHALSCSCSLHTQFKRACPGKENAKQCKPAMNKSTVCLSLRQSCQKVNKQKRFTWEIKYKKFMGKCNGSIWLLVTSYFWALLVLNSVSYIWTVTNYSSLKWCHFTFYMCTQIGAKAKHLEHYKSWLNEPRVCASPYDLISHEHVPHKLTKLSCPKDLQNQSDRDEQLTVKLYE